MPLVVITGFPCSGKSLRAQQIFKHFTEKFSDTTVTIVSDDNIDRNKVFADSNHEKELRGKLFSEVQHLLTPRNLVILDAGNYIKGFRYELYCLSKSIKTTQCVVFLPIAADRAWNWNKERDEAQRYSREIFDALILRYEDPDSKNRWDSPLFIAQYNENLPFDDMAGVLFDRKPPPPNQSTQLQPILPPEFLHDLDRLTQDIVDGIMASGGVVEGTAKRSTLPQLSRLRRQFISYIKLNPIEDVGKIKPLFLQYLVNTSV